jgi:hypothetical protein
MAGQTADQRRSLANLGGEGYTGPYPIPDGDLTSNADRRHLVGLYRFDDVVVPNTQAYRAKVFRQGDILMDFSS